MRFSIEDVEQSIPERFEKVVRQYPDKLAVKIGDHGLTYDELNHAANRLAHTIYSERGDRHEPVILLTEQSIPAIIACLGILKSGKILVLIDAKFPAERISLMMAESNAVGIVAQSDGYSLAQGLAKPSQFIINVDALNSETRQDNLRLAISPELPAQIRFTSGSTGIPKGVVRSHRRILHGHLVTINGGGISSSERMLVVRHLSFTQKDAFNGLLVGAAIFPYDIRKQGISELPKVIAENALTYFTSTPSLFRSFVSELDDTQYFPSVRLIQLGGEPMFKAEVESFKKHFASGCTLMNQLSMNEAGTICQYLITHATEISTEIVPVGYPVEGREVFLVDDQRQNIGCSGVGEIAVKSRYLSNGYLGDSSLTDKRYYSDPHVPEERIYYTGDFGQILPDGRVIYIGRRDDEVKIRGGKVRASEVPSTLVGSPKGKKCYCIAA